MVKRIAGFWCLICCTAIGFSQSTDILRVEFTTLPKGNSEVGFSRYRFLVNMPIKLANDQYMILGGEYNYLVSQNSTLYPFDNTELEKLHVIDLNLGYIFKWNSDWRFVGLVTPRLASNFVNGIQGSDFKLNLAATMWKERKDIEKPFRLVLGLTFNSTTGLPIPLPLINYYKRFHPKWSFVLGIPKMNFKHHITEKHTLEAALFLDGYFVNVQNDIVLPDNNVGSAISLSAVVGAIGYQYNVTNSMSFYTMFGHTLSQEGLLRNDKKDKVFVLSDETGLYFKAGFKIAIF